MSTGTPSGIIQIPDMTRMRRGDVAILRFRDGALTSQVAAQVRARLDAMYPDVVVLLIEADEVVLKRPWRRRRKVKP